MIDLDTYRLTDFIAFNLEVYASQFSQLNENLGLYRWLFVLGNIVLLTKSSRLRVAKFFYLAVVWVFIAYFFFIDIYANIMWAADYVGYLFFLQAALILLLSLVFKDNIYDESDRLSARIGKIIFFISAFIPFSYFLPWTKEEILLFGWGPDQTAFGMIGLALCFKTMHKRLVLALLPAVWLLFQFLTLTGIYQKFS